VSRVRALVPPPHVSEHAPPSFKMPQVLQACTRHAPGQLWAVHGWMSAAVGQVWPRNSAETSKVRSRVVLHESQIPRAPRRHHAVDRAVAHLPRDLVALVQARNAAVLHLAQSTTRDERGHTPEPQVLEHEPHSPHRDGTCSCEV
jgi:hypothetical protein